LASDLTAKLLPGDPVAHSAPLSLGLSVSLFKRFVLTPR